mgnify:CR=1 FL=1|tara:strand:+ start:4658 stop:5386 length:729 start_codon:yes stop_codon:yes gene_type:complete
METPSIGCLLTSFRRPENLHEQLAAVRSQSVPAERIVIFHNGSDMTPDMKEFSSHGDFIWCSENTGVWARFAFALSLFKTEYVAVFDDDTIPGLNWFKNCMECMGKNEALLGSGGVVFPEGTREPREYVGWSSQNEQAEFVDIVGHAWFLKRSWLLPFISTIREGTDTCGEDYHLSYSCQEIGIPTMVPPHPATDRSQWGSLKGELGHDQEALYTKPGEAESKQLAHDAYVGRGWKTGVPEQ